MKDTEEKIKWNQYKQRAVVINYIIYRREETIATIHPKNAYKLEFPDHLLLSFIEQPQSNEAAFAIISFGVYKYLVTSWRNGT